MFRCLIRSSSQYGGLYTVTDFKADGYKCYFCNLEEFRNLQESVDANYSINGKLINCNTMEGVLDGLASGKEFNVDDYDSAINIINELLGSSLLIGSKEIAFEGLTCSKSSTSIYMPIYNEEKDSFNNLKIYDTDKAQFVNPLTFVLKTVPESIRSYGSISGDKWIIDLMKYPITTIDFPRVMTSVWYGNWYADIVFWSEMPNIILNGLNFMVRMVDKHFNNSKEYTSNYSNKSKTIPAHECKIKYEKNTPYKAFDVDDIVEYQRNPGFKVDTPYDDLFLKGMQAITIDNKIGYSLKEVVDIKHYLKREYDKRQLIALKGRVILAEDIIPYLNTKPELIGLSGIELCNDFCTVKIDVN